MHLTSTSYPTAVLLSCVFGVWDHLKNVGNHGIDTYDLEWVGMAIRIMPTCMVVGRGAGVGATLAVEQGILPGSVANNDIREILRCNGAVLEV